jgi:hypothetical protein
MPGDIHEIRIETAANDRDTDRDELAGIVHVRHPRTLYIAMPFRNWRLQGRLTHAAAVACEGRNG